GRRDRTGRPGNPRERHQPGPDRHRLDEPRDPPRVYGPDPGRATRDTLRHGGPGAVPHVRCRELDHRPGSLQQRRVQDIGLRAQPATAHYPRTNVFPIESPTTQNVADWQDADIRNMRTGPVWDLAAFESMFTGAVQLLPSKVTTFPVAPSTAAQKLLVGQDTTG